MLSTIRLIRKSSPLTHKIFKRSPCNEFSLSCFITPVPTNVNANNFLQNTPSSNLQIVHYSKNKAKTKKPSSSESGTDSDDKDFEEETDGLISKILNVHVSSMRVDILIKAGLGIARNKVENLFYESKIRVNGEKLLKKGTTVAVGDEIDVVRGPSTTNPNFMNVSRIEVLSASEKGSGFAVKLRRYKSLIVDTKQMN